MRCAVIKDNIVINTVISDYLTEDMVELTGEYANVGVGWGYNNGIFTTPSITTDSVPDLPKYWNSFDFYRRFTSAERILIRNTAKVDPIVEDFMHTLDAAIASKSNILASDQDTINGLNYLKTMNILTQERIEEILA